jgi:hypothetical protein
MNNKISIGAIILLATSCAPTISDFKYYQQQPLAKTEFMPTEDVVNGKAYKVVVFKLDEDENEVAKQAGLGDALSIDVENVLTKNNLAELVDRKAATKLQKEIALAEMNKTGSYTGPLIADYAVSGSISNAGFSKKFSSGSTFINKDGTLVKIPPKFTYSSDVSGNLKIYELPSMKVTKNIEFKGKKSRTENVQNQGGVSVMGLVDFGGQQAKGIDRDDNLVRKAGEDSIESIDFEIKNFFSKMGYILEKRSLNKKSIFKINVGSSDGIKQGDKFDIIGKYSQQNAITGSSEVERRIIATGKVSDKIDPASCWIIVDDANDVELIRLGDAVKFRYERSWFDKISRFAGNLMD